MSAVGVEIPRLIGLASVPRSGTRSAIVKGVDVGPAIAIGGHPSGDDDGLSSNEAYDCKDNRRNHLKLLKTIF